MIQIRNLTKKYPNVTALDNVSFDVREGEILGLLGPNGAGKTTTMKIITGFIAPTAGEVMIDDLDLEEDSLIIRKKIGYLPESVPLYNNMRVLEYLQFIAQLRELFKDKIKQRLKEVIELCGLEKVAYQFIGELSKGYRQRTALAQSLIHRPPILILDEPTSGLDPNQIVEMRTLIKEIGREKTVILSTHILPEVSLTCDRVVIINEGKIVGQGTIEELKEQIQGKERVYVEMKGIKSAILRALSKPKEILKVNEKDQEAKDIFGFEIIPASNVDIREILFRLASREGFSIIEMRTKKIRLEEVFRQLTK